MILEKKSETKKYDVLIWRPIYDYEISFVLVVAPLKMSSHIIASLIQDEQAKQTIL